MKIEIYGHDNHYLLECIALLFFPVTKFHDNSQDNITFRSILIEEGDNTIGVAQMESPQGLSEVRDQEPNPCSSRAVHAVIGRPFYELCSKVTGLRPPWGMLCGIRPSKLMREFMDSGMSLEETIRYMEGYYLARRDKLELCGKTALCEQTYEKKDNAHSCSLYLSIPFCPSRCHYCSFVSVSNDRALKLLPQYVEYLCRDLEEAADAIARTGLSLKTIYMGGGTPTVLSAEQLQTVLGKVSSLFDVSSLEEYTVEAGRPDCTDREKLQAILDSGATRISINPQTFNNDVLESIGRKHTAEQTEEVYALARAVGFQNINMDLIAGLIGETEEQFFYSVDKALALHPENVTVHSLALKKSSHAKQEQAKEFVQESGKIGAMLDYSQKRLAEEGYQPYYLYRQKNTIGNNENTGYTLPGYEGKYNLYMMGELHSIFGCGAGAATKMVSADRTLIKRVFQPKYPYEYIGGFEETLRNNREKLQEICRQLKIGTYGNN